MKKNLIISALILFSLTQIGCTPYEDGPYITFRSKLNRIAGSIGKQWKSDKYLLQIGQEGYALSIPGNPGFVDVGDWEFNDSGSELLFDSPTFANYDFTIVELKSNSMKITGAFPFDNSSNTHKFECIKEIERLN